MVIASLFALALGLAALSSHADVSLIQASFRPDHYQLANKSSIHQRTSVSLQGLPPRGGHYLIHLHNASDHPVQINDVLFDGASLTNGLKHITSPLGNLHYEIYSMHFPDPELQPWPEKPVLMRAGEPIWYVFQPDGIDPGEYGQFTVRTRNIPKGPVNIEVKLNNGETLGAQIDARDPPAWPTFIGMNNSMNELVVYLEKHPARNLGLKQVILDGRDLTPQANFLAPTFYRDISPILIPLPASLDYGSRHLLEVVTMEEERIVDTFRAWDDFFPIMIYGHGNRGGTDHERTLTLTAELRRLHFNTNLGGGGGILGTSPKSLRIMAKANLLLFGGKSRWFPFTPGAYWALDLQDEPDANDPQIVEKNYGVPHDDRIGFSGMYNIGLMKELHTLAPDKPIWLQINNTGRPRNLFIYGRLADIHCHDVYHRSSPEKPKNIREIYARGIYGYLGGIPRPNHMTVLTTKRIEYHDPRLPFGDEIRLQAYYALACNVKGFSYWLYHGPGASGSPELLEKMGAVNLELATAAPLLARAQIIDEEVTSTTHRVGPVSQRQQGKPDPEIFQRMLLVGKDASILLLTNESYYPDEKGLRFTPLQDISLTVPVPPWLDVAECFSIGHRGIEPVAFRKGDRQVGRSYFPVVKLKISRLDLTKMVVLGNRKLRHQFRNRQIALRKQSAQDVAYAELEHEKLLTSYQAIHNALAEAGTLLQSGFELPEDSDWLGGWVIRDGSELNDEYSRNGRFSIKCVKNSRGLYSRGFGVHPGQKLRVRSHFLLEGPGRGSHLVFIRYLNDKGKELSRERWVKTSDLLGQWARAEAVSTVPEGIVKAQIFWGLIDGKGPLWIDDVAVGESRLD